VTTANWLTILAAVISAAVTWGMLQRTVAALEKTVSELKHEFNRSRESVGQRLEELGRQVTALRTRDEVISEYSRPYGRTGEPPGR
jgi:hypothetical protein